MKTAYWIEFLLKNAWRNLLRNPRRTTLSLLSIASATAAILVFASYEQSLIKTTRNNVITSYYGHFEITQADYNEKKVENPFGFQITETDGLRKDIESKVGPLAFFSRRQEFFGLLNFNDRSFGAVGLAIDAAEEKKFLTLTQVSAGKHLADSPENSIFIGEGVAKSLHVTVGDTLTLLVTTSNGSMNAVDLQVTGFFRTGVTDLDNRAFYVHHELVEQLLRVKGAPRILIGFAQNNELPLKGPLEDLLRKDYSTLRASHWLERASFYENLLGWIKKQISVFYAIVLVISTLSIVNVFMMGLLERVGEFGTWRALGAYAWEVRALIFVESLLQSFLGCLVGVLMGFFIILVPLRNGVVMPPPPMMSVALKVMFEVPWDSVLSTVVTCTFVCGLAGVYPAFKIARLDIVESLGKRA